MFVREADEAHCIGPATAVGGRRPPRQRLPGLRRARTRAGGDTGPGRVGGLGLRGRAARVRGAVRAPRASSSSAPRPTSMRRLGDKVEAKRLAEAAGVPVAPWSGGPVADVEDALSATPGRSASRSWSRRSPAAVDAASAASTIAGGAARGVRERARRGARGLRHRRRPAREVISPARHIEVQVIADGHGAAWALGVRDCSVQRRNQKVIEESASPALTAAQDARAPRRRACGWRCRRLPQRRHGRVPLRARRPSASRSWRSTRACRWSTPSPRRRPALDLVKLQLHIAAGGRLEGEPPPARGHAIEARLNAEDPALDFAPAPGRVELLRLSDRARRAGRHRRRRRGTSSRPSSTR